MIRTSIIAAALVSASAVAVLPVAANAAETDGNRASRTWTGTRKSPASGTTATRPTTGQSTGQSAKPRAGATATAPPRATTPVRNTPVRDASPRDDGDDDRGYRGHSGGIDAAEAARIRRAHDESDGHVYMRHERDHDGTPSYRSRFSTTYNGDWQPPRQRSRHWWHVWR